jgi:hypothetical protein
MTLLEIRALTATHDLYWKFAISEPAHEFSGARETERKISDGR